MSKQILQCTSSFNSGISACISDIYLWDFPYSKSCMANFNILGGAKMATERDALGIVAEALESGAIGVAFGRNIFQHPNPTAMIHVLKQVIHEKASIDDAMTQFS